MRLASFTINGHPGYGFVAGDGVIDLSKRLAYPALIDLIREGGLDEARAQAKATPDYRLSEIRFVPPVPGAEKILQRADLKAIYAASTSGLQAK